MLSPFDDVTPYKNLTHTHVTMLNPETGKQLGTSSYFGSFGETALIGRARDETHITKTFCEVFVVNRADFEHLFTVNDNDTRKLCRKIMVGEQMRKVHEKMWGNLIMSARPNREYPRRTAAQIVQKVWRRKFGDQRALSNPDRLCQLIYPELVQTPPSAAQHVVRLEQQMEAGFFAVDKKLDATVAKVQEMLTLALAEIKEARPETSLTSLTWRGAAKAHVTKNKTAKVANVHM